MKKFCISVYKVGDPSKNLHKLFDNKNQKFLQNFFYYLCLKLKTTVSFYKKSKKIKTKIFKILFLA